MTERRRQEKRRAKVKGKRWSQERTAATAMVADE
jgi:hypothetical protein